MASGHFGRAAEILQKVPAKTPDYWPAQALLCAAYLNSGQPLETRQTAAALFQEDRSAEVGPDLWIMAAYHYASAVGQARPTQAVGCYEDGIAMAHELLRTPAEPEVHRAVRKQLALLLVTFAKTLAVVGDRSRQVTVLQEALSILDKLDIPPAQAYGIADALIALAGVVGTSDALDEADPEEAEELLDDAEEAAEALENETQRQQKLDEVRVARARLTPDSARALSRAQLEAIAEHTLGEGNATLALGQFATASNRARTEGDFEDALRLIRRAKGIDACIPGWNSHRLLYSEALILSDQEVAPEEILPGLFEAADIIYDLFSDSSGRYALQVAADDAHDVFRQLTRTLIDADRETEALAAFEYGRAVEQGIRSGSRALLSALASNPFFSRSQVDTVALRQSGQDLRPGELALVPAIVPPCFTVFTLDREGTVEVRDTPLGEMDERELSRELRALPKRLQDGVEHGAIPGPVWDWGSECDAMIGGRSVRRVAPYGGLHLVPWAPLLYQTLGDWKRVPFETAFSLLIPKQGELRVSGDCTVVAMGHGMTDGSSDNPPIDLEDEARVMASAFRTTAAPATSDELRRALTTAGLVHVSCHGGVPADDPVSDRSLVLVLQDGHQVLYDLLPERLPASVIFLSACESGVYAMGHGDAPAGIAAELVARGARAVLATRFKVDAGFMLRLVEALAPRLNDGEAIEIALARSIADIGSALKWQEAGSILLLAGSGSIQREEAGDEGCVPHLQPE